MGENHYDTDPVAIYGVNLLCSAMAFTLLEKSAILHDGKESKIGMALKNKTKEYVSLAIYITSIALAFFYPAISIIGYALGAIIWIVPDGRIEKQLR